ncbi:dTDP-glucose 4,6-dehydratase [bacterium]|nr:MAG: dTDP-glucose 4,6-dehydratase [bacterium]
MFARILVTGGAGFIGSNLLLRLLRDYPDAEIANLDALTYAGTTDGLPPHHLLEVDLRSPEATYAAVRDFQPDAVIHLAAESHVDRSISGPRAFVETNVLGTLNLLDACRVVWGPSFEGKRFHHVSTDEVYGSLGAEGFFREDTPYDPSSPYSASKAGSDHLVRAYHRTYGLPVTLTNCSNNYGPRQFPEKLIPVMILNALESKPLPVYGDGLNVRDWLHVDDHVTALLTVLEWGELGRTYNVGGNAERTNLQVIAAILDAVALETGRDREVLEGLVTFVDDRPGHDRRYAIDPGRIQSELNWKPERGFEEGMLETVRWYLENLDWVDRIRSGAYREGR